MNKSAENSTQQAILSQITKRRRGHFFFLQDFATSGSRDAVKKAFQRLANDGTLIRIANGIYYYPKIDTELGLGVLHPSMDEIAQAIARRDRITIIPTGSFALNMLGLSTQVVTNAVYVTNGSPRRIKIGEGRGILFIHTSDNKMLAFKSRLMMLIVSAMREIGEPAITEQEILQLKSFLSHVSDADFRHDISLAPVWIQKILTQQ